MSEPAQSLQSHAKYDPPFHFFLAPVGLFLLGWSVYQLIQTPTMATGVNVLLVIWILVAIFKLRIYPLKVQDRVIRLEEGLRIEKLCGAGRAEKLTIDQLIGLRFASDRELPALVDKAIANNLPRKEIKALIQSWRADNWRV